VSKIDDMDTEGTNGNNPNPNNLLTWSFEDKLGESEQYSSRSSLSSLAREDACEAERKSSHGFAELQEGEFRRCCNVVEIETYLTIEISISCLSMKASF
jgi:hypothetical protein